MAKLGEAVTGIWGDMSRVKILDYARKTGGCDEDDGDDDEEASVWKTEDALES